MKTYEIKYEPITIEGKLYPKYNIYYYINGELETVEFYSKDGISGEVRQGYEKK